MSLIYPRLMIAGTSGDSGKTNITLGLARAWIGQGLTVTAFKKGPDYIDAAWLSAATGRTSRNLDTYLSKPESVRNSFFLNAVSEGINLIEGNRGLHDGMDVDGSHSSAALSKLIKCPVVLVQDITKVTRSAAAFVLGSKVLDPEVDIAGIILNRVAGSRHERIVRQSIETYCGIPVLGAVPKLSSDYQIPSRHLGLVTPREEDKKNELLMRLGKVAQDHLDMARLKEIAESSPKMAIPHDTPVSKGRRKTSKRITICYLSDSAFSFYYPDNIEALSEAGADLIPVSALDDKELPPCSALYAGGGFPETHARALSENRSFRESLFTAAEAGLPVYAECGGLIFLSEALSWKGVDYPMSGVFPIRTEVQEKPYGHGYGQVVVDGDNPFFEKGVEIKGHEFHYSHPEAWTMKSVFNVRRGTGCGNQRDGLLRWNVLGTYLHIHALGCPLWAQGLIGAAERYRKE